MRFFVGLHQPSDARHFDAAFISVNRIKDRKSPFAVGDWIMDSGAFTTIQTHGGYPEPVESYAAQIRRWKGNGNLLATVSQDYMCEPAMLAKTGLAIADHQRLTIARYDALLHCDTGCYILPVLQGYAPEDYVSHIRQYGDRLAQGAWVGVGSICKRNGDPGAILRVLLAIKAERPDLELHGFGLKKTALDSQYIRELLATADSMSWSFAARRQNRNANDWREAMAFVKSIGAAIARPRQPSLFDLMRAACFTLILAGCGTKPENTATGEYLPCAMPNDGRSALNGTIYQHDGKVYVCTDPRPVWKSDCEPNNDPHPGDVQIDPLYCGGGK